MRLEKSGSGRGLYKENCCPATHILRREAFERCGGYDENMRKGFEDWDFFLSILETTPDAVIGVVRRNAD